MQIPILIEPIAGGRFRARSGEPFAFSAEGDTEQESIQGIERMLKSRIDNGARCAVVNVPNGVGFPFPADDLYKTDLGFREWQEEIAENRRREDENEMFKS